MKKKGLATLGLAQSMARGALCLFAQEECGFSSQAQLYGIYIQLHVSYIIQFMHFHLNPGFVFSYYHLLIVWSVSLAGVRSLPALSLPTCVFFCFYLFVCLFTFKAFRALLSTLLSCLTAASDANSTEAVHCAAVPSTGGSRGLLSLPFNWRVPWLLCAIDYLVTQLTELRKPLLTGLVTYFKRVQFRHI